MTRWLLLLLILLIGLLPACSLSGRQGTIGQLRGVEIEIVDEQLEGGLDKAIASYQRFLEEAQGTVMGAEAIRRLADLKVEKEYGVIAADSVPEPQSGEPPAPEQISSPLLEQQGSGAALADERETREAFERRAIETQAGEQPSTAADDALPIDDLERAGALEAVALYKKLLAEYPLYERNDQVLYQLSRAYEELGRIEEAMEVMNRLVREYPDSRYLDEVQFRRAEYFFTHRRYLDAEEAYGSVVEIGVGSSFYLLSLYKLGWTFYKQELYEEALHRYIALLDYKLFIGYDFSNIEDDIEGKRVADTLRVISLSFSNLGGSDALVEYFSRYGKRSFEDKIYANLAEHYFDKRRYSDAVATYTAFVERNRFHREAPRFALRVIEIHTAGGFPSLVIEAKKQYAREYALSAEYWQYFVPRERPEVLDGLKSNLTDLANHYHALYQKPKLAKAKNSNFAEAVEWYRAYLVSFPQDAETPAVHYQLASLLLENGSFGEAAREYEKVAYDYPPHEQAAQAGYAAVYAYRQHLPQVAEQQQEAAKREIIRSSLKFAESFPEHEKAPVVMVAAADDLYLLGDFAEALKVAHQHLELFPETAAEIRRSAWLVTAHSSYELELFAEAEAAYLEVLELLDQEDASRVALVDNLAASIYKQGEQASKAEDYLAAAEHFLRISSVTPTSSIRPAAEFDAATALIQLKDWQRTISVLSGFRSSFPGHKLQHEVTKKMAFVYREDKQYGLAAEEYERIERESSDDEVRREVLLIAAELHEKVGNLERTLGAYRRYVSNFPKPLEFNLETRDRIAAIYRKQQNISYYHDELRLIVSLDAAAGSERTARTRYLAGKAALVFAEIAFEEFAAVELLMPFETNLRKKQGLMKQASQQFARLLDYEVGDITAAATYYMAEIYADFSVSLTGSQRPEGLSPLELEEYELMIEEQAYPFEEKAIETHESNVALLAIGIYSRWIDSSIGKLAVVSPARYAKPEEEAPAVAPLETFSFENEALVKLAAQDVHESTPEQVVQEEGETAPHGDEPMQQSQGVAGDPVAAEESEVLPPEPQAGEEQPLAKPATGEEAADQASAGSQDEEVKQ